MTAWNNFGFMTETEEQRKEVLKYLFNNNKNRLVCASPPTIMYGGLNEREKDNIAKKYLKDKFDNVDKVVVVQNGDTGDSAKAYIYREPDDLRDVDKEIISGFSGAKAVDVKQKLNDRELCTPVRHFYETLDRENFTDLLDKKHSH